jgi:hypothetical protein
MKLDLKNRLTGILYLHIIVLAVAILYLSLCLLGVILVSYISEGDMFSMMPSEINITNLINTINSSEFWRTIQVIEMLLFTIGFFLPVKDQY